MRPFLVFIEVEADKKYSTLNNVVHFVELPDFCPASIIEYSYQQCLFFRNNVAVTLFLSRVRNVQLYSGNYETQSLSLKRYSIYRWAVQNWSVCVTRIDRPVYRADIWVLPIYWYQPKRPILSASVVVDKTMLYSSRIQTTCARKHNKPSQNSYLAATLAGAFS